MTRKLVQDSELFKLINEFQTKFTLNSSQMDAFYDILEDIDDRGVPSGDGMVKVEDKNAVISANGIKVTTAGSGKLCWIWNEETNTKMYIRNQSHAKGLMREIKKRTHISAWVDRDGIKEGDGGMELVE